MSLTEAESVFAGVHEDGLNDMLRAFFQARPRLLNYRTTLAVGPLPPAASAWTPLPPIAFPGVPGGIHYAFQMSIPRIDLHPDSSGGIPPPLSLNAGEFSLQTTVMLALLCGQKRRPDNRDERITGTILPVKLEVWAVGRVVSQSFGGGAGEIGFEVRAVEIVDITPDDLESLLECLVHQLINGVLSSVRLPYTALSAGAFTLTLLRGPEVETDQVQVYGQIA
ncbi:MAG: hypothetical protein H0X16_08060 [Chloroflexi bacterium]|nr:hypothetical protein [Chloroflexota bacterium]